MAYLDDGDQILGLYKRDLDTSWSVSRKVVTKNTKCQEPTKFASKHQKLTWPQSKYTGQNLTKQIKVGCVFPMVIWSEFHMGKHRDADPEHVLHFKPWLHQNFDST